MPRTKLPERLQLKLDTTTRYLLEQISATLGVDMSNTIRLTIREKARTLGIEVPAQTEPSAKKKRRAAP